MNFPTSRRFGRQFTIRDVTLGVAAGTEGFGVQRDLEILRGYKTHASLSVVIDQGDYDALMAYVSKADTWSPTRTCADWSRDAFYAATGQYLDVDDYLGIETPRELSESIRDFR